VNGSPVALGGRKPRAVLGALLLRAGTAVPVDELIDAVWGDAAPPTALKSLQVSVANLRRLLGRDRIRTHGAAYAVVVEDDELDAKQFEHLVAEGRAALQRAEHAQASDLLASGLALWSGRVCEDVAFESPVNADAERLEELRRSALHDRVDADLALGRHAQLVPELERLVAVHPLDEELRAQQMAALYRSGRQSDALNIYTETRGLLVDQLGVEPGERLRALHRRILEHDPELAAPERAADVAEAPVASPRRRLLAVGAIAIAAAAAAALLIVEGSGSGGTTRHIAPDTAGVVDVASGQIGRTAAAGPEPTAIAYGNGSAWIADAGGDTVTRIGDGGHVADMIPIGGNVTAIAFGESAVWAVSGERRTLDEINPETDTVVRRIDVGNGPRAAAVGADSVWVANGIDGSISRIDAKTGRPVATIPVGGTPTAIAVGSNAVWVADTGTDTVVRIDPASDAPIASIAVGQDPDAVVAAHGSVWVANGLDGTASRIDARTDSVSTTVQVGANPSSLAFTDGSVWVGSGSTGSVSKLDPVDGDVERTVRIGSRPAALAGAGRHLWVAGVASPASRRGGTLRVLANTGYPAPTFDPATDWSALGWQVLAITNDGLLTYRRVGGVDGNDLEPDLAESLSTPSDGGRTYTFTLRPDIRYSDGGRVKASDVRASIERVFRLRSPTLGAFTLGLVGERACLAHPRRCNLAHGIVADNSARTVTFHLTRPNPAFLRILALPVYAVLPAGTPPGARIGTGPYRIASWKRNRLVLARNARFREWSADAQPDGFPDRILWNLATSPARGTAQVIAGRADVLVPPPPSLSTLVVREPALLHSDRSGFVRYLFLNTTRAPFDRLDVRRALNLAVDRRRAVAAFGGALQAEPTCQLLPPNIAGYRPYCPYTLHPGPAETWSAPNLAEARRLVRRSGTEGRLVKVWTEADSSDAVRFGRYLVSLLRTLGYRSVLVARPAHPTNGARDYFSLVSDPRTGAQIGLSQWTPDYPSPAEFFKPLLTCGALRAAGGSNFSRFCDPRIDRAIARADRLDRAASPAAAAAWAQVDRAVVDEAPLVPLVAQRQVTLVSHRVGNYEFNPVLGGVLIDQLWIAKRRP
jgi:peptide/nickel transport system substrate-binding protein